MFKAMLYWQYTTHIAEIQTENREAETSHVVIYCEDCHIEEYIVKCLINVNHFIVFQNMIEICFMKCSTPVRIVNI